MLPIALQAIRLPQFPRAFQSYKRKPEPPVAGAVLCSAGNYLLVRGRHSGKWSFPKGHKEHSETLEQTIQREVQEEVGIKALPPYVSEFQGRVGTYRVFNLSAPIRPCPQDLDEVDAADWFSLEEVVALPLNVDASFYFSKVHSIRCRPVTNSPPLPTLLSDDASLEARAIPSLG